MQVITPQAIKGKRVLIRLDIDVPIKLKAQSSKLKTYEIGDDFRLRRDLETLEMCLKYGRSVVGIGHLGRPAFAKASSGKTKESDLLEFSVAPVVNWFADHIQTEYEDDQFIILDNLRFFKGEDDSDPDFAKELASYGEVYINEAFAAHHLAASTTLLPKLLPSYAGLNFAKEVSELTKFREQPKRPQVALIGGAKIEDKYPAVVALSKLFDAVLVGGLLAEEIRAKRLEIDPNVVLAEANSSGLDISKDSAERFKKVLQTAKQIVWVGPLGKYEVLAGNQSNLELARFIIHNQLNCVIGGGDTAAALKDYLDQFSFVSTGGGASLELLINGTLPTIEALS